MKFGHYSDNDIPKFTHDGLDQRIYNINSHGYRCPEFPSKSLEGGKNVVVLGCSHTFGIGSSDDELWVNLFQNNLQNDRLRFWNLGQPGASSDLITRILYATEKVLFPDIVLVCWPHTSRRERLERYPRNITGANDLLKTETEDTDRQIFLKNVFFVEKFAEHRHAKVFHCFAEDIQEFIASHVFSDNTLKNCWPAYDSAHVADADRSITKKPSFARDGVHYGKEHHERFAKQLYKSFSSKFR